MTGMLTSLLLVCNGWKTYRNRAGSIELLAQSEGPGERTS